VSQTLPVDTASDILPAYAGTPIERLLRYHNLDDPLPATTSRAELLVGMCMDDRKDLIMPNELAFVMRAAGGNLRDHMVGLRTKRDAFVRALVARGGWDEIRAGEHFDASVPVSEINDAVAFVLDEARWLRAEYPAVLVAPLLYRVEDDRLLQLVAG
jgi:carbonic anhydrase